MTDLIEGIARKFFGRAEYDYLDDKPGSKRLSPYAEVVVESKEEACGRIRDIFEHASNNITPEMVEAVAKYFDTIVPSNFSHEFVRNVARTALTAALKAALPDREGE